MGVVSRVVIEFGDICDLERLRGICNASEVAAPDISIGNEMTATRSSIPDACDTSFGAVESNKYQMDRIPSGFRLAHQIHSAAAGEGRLDCKTHIPIKVVRCPFQNFSSGRDGCGRGFRRIQTAGYCIGIEQQVATFELDRLRDCGFSGSVWTCNDREGCHAALGGVRRQFAENLVVLSRRCAGQPADLKPSSVGALHYVETIAIDIEDRKSGRQRVGKGFVTRRPDGVVKLRATEIANSRHA